MVLSEQQKKELNRAIADYLKNNHYSRALTAFKEDAAVDDEDTSKYRDLLEKKWSSVIRLQKKVFDLDAKLSETENELQAMQASSGFGLPGAVPGSGLAGAGDRGKHSIAEAIPRPPAKFTLTGHRSPVTRVLFHPHYNLFVSASEDASIKVWEFETGELEHTLKGHTDSVQDLAFKHDGSMLASCSADISIKLWDVTVWQCCKTLTGHEHNVSSVAFLPPLCDFLVSASRDKTIKMWEISTGHCVKTFSGHSQWVRCVRPSPDGQRLASCSNDHTVRIWATDNAKASLHTLSGHDNVVEYVQWANYPQAALAIHRSASKLNNDDTSKNPADSSRTRNGLDSLADDSDALTATLTYLASASRDRTIRIWNVQTGMLVTILVGHDNWVRQLVFHPHGSLLLSASDDKTVRVWDLVNMRCQKRLDAHTHFVNTIDMSRKAPVVATGTVDREIRIWDCR